MLNRVTEDTGAVIDVLNNRANAEPNDFQLSYEEMYTLMDLGGKLRQTGVIQQSIRPDELLESYCDYPRPGMWVKIVATMSILVKACDEVIEILRIQSGRFTTQYDELVTRLLEGMISRKEIHAAIKNTSPPTSRDDLDALRSIARSYSKLRAELKTERQFLIEFLRTHNRAYY